MKTTKPKNKLEKKLDKIMTKITKTRKTKIIMNTRETKI